MAETDPKPNPNEPNTCKWDNSYDVKILTGITECCTKAL